MASTITRHGAGGAFSKPLVNSNRTLKIVTFDLDTTSYATGGEDISAVINEFAQVLAVFAQNNSATPGAIYTYNPAAKKLIAWWSGTASATLNEVTNATDLNQARVIVFGY